MKLYKEKKIISTKFISEKQGNEGIHFYMHSSMDVMDHIPQISFHIKF